MSSYCAECHTTDKLIWIDELDDCVCQSCLVLAYTSLAESVNKREAAERTADELRARIDNLEQEVAELRGELKMSYTSDDPRITVNEWQAETPYGQMLDGLGDEVEP